MDDRSPSGPGRGPGEMVDGKFECELPEPVESSEKDYRSVPEGSYVCRIELARSRLTKGGDRLWALMWVVDEGPETGRVAAWDNLVFSARAAPRTKRILTALGLPSSGRLRLGADDFVGRRGILQLVAEHWTNPETGRVVMRNQVTYDGVRPLPESGAEKSGPSAHDEASAEEDEDGSEIPF